jgi:hypothetical protein
VSVERWLAAMPTSVVTPEEAQDVAEQMLADVPLPPGFTLSTLPNQGTNNYYDFGALVIGRVTCGWLETYQGARAANDEPEMARVEKTFAGSKQWTVLQEMAKEGDYPAIAVWQFIDPIRKRQPIPTYQNIVGCP